VRAFHSGYTVTVLITISIVQLVAGKGFFKKDYGRVPFLAPSNQELFFSSAPSVFNTPTADCLF